MAWLHATPEKEKVPRGARLEIKRRRGEEVPELEPPELEPTLEYLVGYFLKVGPGVGDHELTFAELDAWCRRSGRDLDDFESDALKQMSRAYLGMLHKAKAPECPSPAIEFDETDPEQVAARRAQVDQGLRKMFAGLEEAKSGMRKGARN
ncbi:hypothetical protein [Massilia sp. METH4]|uniref:phage tail assembly chaperone n=1 Tax=Massilia sp. METH4 TaxID=3123041 RepID=UPI0030D1A8BD